MDLSQLLVKGQLVFQNKNLHTPFDSHIEWTLPAAVHPRVAVCAVALGLLVNELYVRIIK